MTNQLSILHPASNISENIKSIILYPPTYDTYIINESEIFDGFVDSKHGIPDATIGIYEENDKMQDCFINEYHITDPISTYYSFVVKINNTLIQCDEDFATDKKLEFVTKMGSNFSNLIDITVLPSIDELPTPRWEFEPKKFNIPNNITVLFFIDNNTTISKNVYLDHYHINDKYPDNIEKYYPLESLDPNDINDYLHLDNTTKNISLVLNFSLDNNKSRDPSFVNVFMNNIESNETFIDLDIFNLYELEQIDQDPWMFSIPKLPTGNYEIKIRVYFGDILGEYRMGN